MTFAGLVNNLVSIINGSVIPFIYALAFLYFIWGIAQFIFIGGQEGREKGRNKIIYGLLGLVIIFSVWGLVNVLLTVLTGGAPTPTSTL